MMNKRTRDLRRLISYHEAGHAVAARLLGCEIVDIDMAPDTDRDCLATVRSYVTTWAGLGPDRPDDRAALERALYTNVMVNMAGIASQKLAGFPTNDDDFINGDDADIDKAFHHADQLTHLKAGLPLRPGPDEPSADDNRLNFDPFADDDDDVEVDLDINQWCYADHRRRLKTGSPLRLDAGAELHELRIASTAIVDHAEDEISALLKANWSAVMRVAAALAKRDQLTQAELDHIIARGQRSGA